MDTSETFESISLALSTQSRCDGSAKAMVGKSDAVAGVYGPLESKASSQIIEGVLEVSYKAHLISTSTQEDADYASTIRQALSSCIQTLPRTTTSLSVRVMADEGNGFCAAVMAAVAALVDAGIALLKIPVGIEVTLGQDGTPSFSPSLDEKALARARLLMIFCGEDEGPSTLISSGVCSRQELLSVLTKSRNRAQAIRLEMESVFKQHALEDKDLCI